MEKLGPLDEIEIDRLAELSPALIEYHLQESAARRKEAAELLVTLASDLCDAQAENEEREEEADREYAWWETFRVALGGLAANGKMTIDEVHEFATKLANKVHGPIEKTATE